MSPFEVWAKKLKINPDSPTTQQLYENRYLTVEKYIDRFRKGRIKAVLPTSVLGMTIEEALQRPMIDGRNIRKLLASGREKFSK